MRKCTICTLIDLGLSSHGITDFRTIRTIHLIVKRQLSLNDMYHLLELQNANGSVILFDHASTTSGVDDGGLATWLLAGARVAQKGVQQRAQSPLMKRLFPKGIAFGLMGDGSNDRSLAEQEAVVLRFLGADAKPFNSFFDLAELDLMTSDDGRSPDASCITACYASSLSQLNKIDGFIFMNDWKKALIAASFDGASVMLGANGGVGKKLMDMTENMKIVIHAAAHVTQLGNADAFSLNDYYVNEWRPTVQEVYVEYAHSGKKRFGLEEIAVELGEHLLKLTGSHGIRWAAAQANTTKALLQDLPSVVADLEYRAKTALGLHYTQLTPSSSFLRKTFFDTFENDQGKRSRWKCTVKSFTPSTDGIAANDTFTIGFSNKTVMPMSKAELVAKLTDAEKSGLAEDSRWLLRQKVVLFRFAAFTAFMLDVHEQLSILSRSYQSNTLVVFDISRNLNISLSKLTKLKTKPGEHESTFLEAVAENHNAHCLRTCQLELEEGCKEAFKEDRIAICDGLCEQLKERFQKVLDNPLLKAMAVFDHKKWPRNNDILRESWHDEITLLFETFKAFFPEGTTADDVIEQWVELAVEINDSPGLSGRKFHELWPDVIIHYSDESVDQSPNPKPTLTSDPISDHHHLALSFASHLAL